jgi:ribonuclease HI
MKRARVAYERLILHFDGCTRPHNPGPSGAGWCISTPEGKGVRFGFNFIGESETNNSAEYQGLLHGMDAALDLDVEFMTIRGDSKLVVEQVNGRWKCKAAHLQPLIRDAQAKMKKFSKVKLEHIPREQNTWADFLSNQAVNLRDSKSFDTEDMLTLSFLKSGQYGT